MMHWVRFICLGDWQGGLTLTMCDLATTPEYPYGKLHGVFRLLWFRRTWVSSPYNPLL